MAAGRKSDRAGAAPLRAQVVVMGDFGRSPRMQYHALSLAQQAGMEVDVVAFEGSTPIALLTQEPKVHLRLISPPYAPSSPAHAVSSVCDGGWAPTPAGVSCVGRD